MCKLVAMPIANLVAGEQEEKMPEKGGRETPLLDLSDAAVRELIRTAKKRGYVTHDQINALLSCREEKRTTQ